MFLNLYYLNTFLSIVLKSIFPLCCKQLTYLKAFQQLWQTKFQLSAQLFVVKLFYIH